jgi:hypothetical protein
MKKPLKPGDTFKRTGCVTRLISVINQPPAELARRLGYNPGRLSAGWALLLLKEQLKAGDFRFAGYTHFSGGRIGHPALGDSRTAVHDDLGALLANPNDFAARFAQSSMPLSGSERIVKIIPLSDPDPALSDADLYPVGSGIPQWILIEPKLFLVSVVVRPGMVHLGGGVDLPEGFWVDPAKAKTQ